MASSATKREELRRMLRDVFIARAAGTSYARMARAHGYVDGYMRALIECGEASREELLRLVAEERERVSGPATARVTAADLTDAAA